MTNPTTEAYDSSPPFRADLATVADALRAGRQSTRFDARIAREAVRAFAVHARLNRCPPERVIRALKELVREIALEDDSDAYRVVFTDRVIAWAIESYYELGDH